MKLSPSDCKVEIHRDRVTGEVTRLIYQPSDLREPRTYDQDHITAAGVSTVNDCFQMCGCPRFSPKEGL